MPKSLKVGATSRLVTFVGVTYKPTILHYSVHSFFTVFTEQVHGFDDYDQHVKLLSSFQSRMPWRRCKPCWR